MIPSERNEPLDTRLNRHTLILRGSGEVFGGRTALKSESTQGQGERSHPWFGIPSAEEREGASCESFVDIKGAFQQEGR